MKADDTISAWSTNKPLAIVSAADLRVSELAFATRALR